MKFSRRTPAMFAAVVAMLLILASHPSAQSHVCHRYGDINDEYSWLQFEAGNQFLSGRGSVDYYTYQGSLGCIDVGGQISPPGGGWVYAASEAAALELCEDNLGDVAGVRRDQSSVSNSIYICRLGSGGSDGDGADDDSVSCRGGIKLPLSGLRIQAAHGMNSGIQFSRLSNCGVGDPAVFEMGFLDAVDVWSTINGGYTVCFPQNGQIVFLDAATSPRTLMEIEYETDQDQTCAAMDRAGTLVLVKAEGDASDETPPHLTRSTRRPGTDDSINDAIDLQKCIVTPRVNLRLRAAPWGEILDVIPGETDVPATARTESWFKVNYEDTEGWSAAWLASADANCARTSSYARFARR